MKNITKQIREAISVDTLWSISDFFNFIEMLNNKGFKTSHWIGEENWATLLLDSVLIGYIWQKYPLIFIKEDHVDELMIFTKEFKYIVLIKSNDLESEEFSMNLDEELVNRINYGIDPKNFSATDFWFHTVT